VDYGLLRQSGKKRVPPGQRGWGGYLIAVMVAYDHPAGLRVVVARAKVRLKKQIL
jgi:hypothetical protein